MSKNNLDFTVKKYYDLCKVIKQYNYSTLTFKDYLIKNVTQQRTIILRHDIDRKPLNALALAKIENEFDIQSTYYFRYNKHVFQPEIIRKIKDMGHEIGYHYEVLSKSNGNYKKAIDIFQNELNEFRNYYDVKTICMHGSPISKYDNRDIWKIYNFKDYGIIGEAYLSVNENLSYFSDTGRSWNWKNKIRDFVPGKIEKYNINTTDELINLIKSDVISQFYILVHPERWALDNIGWVSGYIMDLAVNAGKKFIISVR